MGKTSERNHLGQRLRRYRRPIRFHYKLFFRLRRKAYIYDARMTCTGISGAQDS
jgi:hypothetical protein